jgi:acetyl/propionyl-CoA carboxylase alpha subunit
MPLSFTFSVDGDEHEVGILARRPELSLSVDGTAHQVAAAGALSGDCILLTVDGRSYQVWRTWEGDRVHLRIGSRTFSIGYEDPILAAQHHAGGDDVLRADMPGVVVGVHCEAGGHVSTGDTLMVIESMKMQINIVAHRDGIVETVHADVNETFDKGAELITMHAES